MKECWRNFVSLCKLWACFSSERIIKNLNTKVNTLLKFVDILCCVPLMVSLNMVAFLRTLSPNKPVSAEKSVFFFLQFNLHNFLDVLKCRPPASKQV